MSNYQERENSHLRNALSFFTQSSEQEIFDDFVRRFAQAGDGSEEDLSGEVGGRNLDPNAPEGLAAPAAETEEILAEPDNAPADIRDEWSQFVIELDSDMSAKLQSEQNLSPEDADDKSSYIKYTDSKTGKTYGIQGPMFGLNREQGIGENIIGGYKSAIEIQKDLDKMQETWVEGFPADREYLVVEKSELSPSLQAYERRKENELPNLVEDQSELADMADKKDEEEDTDTEAVEEALTAPAPEEKPSSVSKTTPQPTIPKPLGKVPASLMALRMKRESRLKILKNIKGK